MQWTDEQIIGIRKLASEGFTRRKTADKLGISYDAVQKKSRRLGIEFQSPMPNEYDSDGTHTTYTIHSHPMQGGYFHGGDYIVSIYASPSRPIILQPVQA